MERRWFKYTAPNGEAFYALGTAVEAERYGHWLKARGMTFTYAPLGAEELVGGPSLHLDVALAKIDEIDA